MSSYDDELAPGTILSDRYAIEASIGRGGSGVVYRARQIGLDRIVAVKVLHENVAFASKELERFRREAVTTGRLRHPNIVTVHDFGTLPDGRSFLVLEYLSGPSLDKWIAERGPTAPDLAAEIVKAVCGAVQASHAQGVIHRDLKPSNVILPAEGDPAMLKVVDFGVARVRETDSTLTGGLVIGTPAYVAPEVIEGDTAEERADVYSLGLIAYELVTGRRPFTGRTSYSFLYQHLAKDPAPPSSIVPGLSVALDAVVLRALAKDPAKRYETATEFGDAFEIVAREAARRRGGQRPAPAAPADAAEARKRVLVVEDDEVLLRLVQAILKSSGYESALAADGIEALMALGSGGFDLVISDVDMPNLDGFQLLEMMAAKQIRTPVIFLTSYEEPEREVRGFELGAADFIRKPISPAVLVARIKRVLER